MVRVGRNLLVVFVDAIVVRLSGGAVRAAYVPSIGQRAFFRVSFFGYVVQRCGLVRRNAIVSCVGSVCRGGWVLGILKVNRVCVYTRKLVYMASWFLAFLALSIALAECRESVDVQCRSPPYRLAPCAV